MTRKDELEIILADMLNNIYVSIGWMAKDFTRYSLDENFEREYEKHKAKLAMFEKYLKEYNQLRSFIKD